MIKAIIVGVFALVITFFATAGAHAQTATTAPTTTTVTTAPTTTTTPTTTGTSGSTTVPNGAPSTGRGL